MIMASSEADYVEEAAGTGEREVLRAQAMYDFDATSEVEMALKVRRVPFHWLSV